MPWTASKSSSSSTTDRCRRRPSSSHRSRRSRRRRTASRPRFALQALASASSPKRPCARSSSLFSSIWSSKKSASQRTPWGLCYLAAMFWRACSWTKPMASGALRSSRRLRSIGVSVGVGEMVLEELIVEDTPRLERLLLPMLLCRLHVRVIAAPKLEVLGWLPDFRPRLNLGIDVPREQNTNTFSLMMVTRSVKIVALRTQYLSLDVVINLMRCFPCLTSLYISSVNRGDEENNLWHAEQLGRMECINQHLKKIILSGFVMHCMSQVNFIKFFVLNARVLQSMRFEIPPVMPAEWIEMQPELLQLKDRASSDAQLDFSTDSDRLLCCPVNLKWVSNLSRTDPFVSNYRNCAW